MTETKNISFRPLSQLTEDELKQHLGRKLADLSKLSQGSLEEKLGTAAYRPYVNSIAEDIRQIEAEQRYRREMRMQESMVTVWRRTKRPPFARQSRGGMARTVRTYSPVGYN